MAKNRIAYYTKEGVIQSVNIDFTNYTVSIPSNTLQNIFERTIARAGTDGSKLLGLKLNNFLPFTSGTLSSSGTSGFYFSLRYRFTDPFGVLPTDNIILKTVKFDSTNAINSLTQVISSWDKSILAQQDQRGNSYINLPPGAELILSCDAVTISVINATSYNLGKNNDLDPRAIKILAYLEEY